VPARILDDIDHNRFARLPGGILTKGHLRAYAAAVGLNSDQMVRRYMEEFGAARGRSGANHRRRLPHLYR
jgi:cytoskeletal protein RodZ